MPKWIGNRFGNTVPIAPNIAAPSGIYNIIDQYYSKKEGGWTLPPDGLEATGGTIHDYEEGGVKYRAHIFTGSGVFNVTTLGTGSIGSKIEYMIVGGGGGGGTHSGGGGGAGGLLLYAEAPIGGKTVNGAGVDATVSAYPVVIGAGAIGGKGTYPSPNGDIGGHGGDTTFNGQTANGGGGGGNHASAGTDGGSGGGGARQDS